MFPFICLFNEQNVPSKLALQHVMMTTKQKAQLTLIYVLMFIPRVAITQEMLQLTFSCKILPAFRTTARFTYSLTPIGSR